MKEVFTDTRTRMQKALEALEHHLSVLRTGRANSGMLNKITVDYYGSAMPVNQMANITTPDARTLVVTPFDRSGLAGIEKAIRDSDLGLNPANKGDALYITIPALTEERRKICRTRRQRHYHCPCHNTCPSFGPSADPSTGLSAC